jgi:hypothetical protein
MECSTCVAASRTCPCSVRSSPCGQRRHAVDSRTDGYGVHIGFSEREEDR